jgi:hypothetical protein
MAVVEDVFKEESKFILCLKTLDIGTFKGLAAKACLTELDWVINEAQIAKIGQSTTTGA